MKKTTYQYYCDVCGKEVEEKNIERGFSLPVYFLNTKKFINKEIDLCFKCLNKIVVLDYSLGKTGEKLYSWREL